MGDPATTMAVIGLGSQLGGQMGLFGSPEQIGDVPQTPGGVGGTEGGQQQILNPLGSSGGSPFGSPTAGATFQNSNPFMSSPTQSGGK